jgi:hypothetical protein
MHVFRAQAYPYVRCATSLVELGGVVEDVDKVLRLPRSSFTSLLGGGGGEDLSVFSIHVWALLTCWRGRDADKGMEGVDRTTGKWR